MIFSCQQFTCTVYCFGRSNYVITTKTSRFEYVQYIKCLYFNTAFLYYAIPFCIYHQRQFKKEQRSICPTNVFELASAC